MSDKAILTEETTYSWWCENCGQGGSDYDSENAAEAEMNEHNEENHGGDE